MKYTYTGAKTDIQLALKAIEIEVNNLIDKLVLQRDKLISAGISERISNKTILDEVSAGEGLFGSWVNQQNSLIKTLENELIAKPTLAYANENPETKFAWILSGGVKEHCEDCYGLSEMEPRTISEWRDLGFGLPREGGTECSYGCKCMLEEV